MKYCPDCGAKTLVDGGEHDLETGDFHTCLSCGYRLAIHEMDRVQQVVQSEPPQKEYKPLYSHTELMLARASAHIVLSAFADGEAFSRGLVEGEKIVFRRYGSFGGRTI